MTISNEVNENSTATGRVEQPYAPTFSGAETEAYQSLSRAAVAALAMGVLGFLAFPAVILVVLPLLGLLFTFIALRSILKFPDELQGRSMAIAGGILSGFTLIAAPAYHTWVYMTEVPDGYARVDFSLLKSGLGQPDLPPLDALDMDGQKIFIKGYIHPTSMDTMLAKRFVLVPDLGTCCFGGQPPLTHMIEVSLSGDQYAKKSYRKQRLAGTLHVNPNLKPVDGLTGVYYQLRADILK